MRSNDHHANINVSRNVCDKLAIKWIETAVKQYKHATVEFTRRKYYHTCTMHTHFYILIYENNMCKSRTRAKKQLLFPIFDTVLPFHRSQSRTAYMYAPCTRLPIHKRDIEGVHSGSFPFLSSIRSFVLTCFFITYMHTHILHMLLPSIAATILYHRRSKDLVSLLFNIDVKSEVQLISFAVRVC